MDGELEEDAEESALPYRPAPSVEVDSSSPLLDAHSRWASNPIYTPENVCEYIKIVLADKQTFESVTAEALFKGERWGLLKKLVEKNAPCLAIYEEFMRIQVPPSPVPVVKRKPLRPRMMGILDAMKLEIYARLFRTETGERYDATLSDVDYVTFLMAKLSSKSVYSERTVLVCGYAYCPVASLEQNTLDVQVEIIMRTTNRDVELLNELYGVNGLKLLEAPLEVLYWKRETDTEAGLRGEVVLFCYAYILWKQMPPQPIKPRSPNQTKEEAKAWEVYELARNTVEKSSARGVHLITTARRASDAMYRGLTQQGAYFPRMDLELLSRVQLIVANEIRDTIQTLLSTSSGNDVILFPWNWSYYALTRKDLTWFLTPELTKGGGAQSITSYKSSLTEAIVDVLFPLVNLAIIPPNPSDLLVLDSFITTMKRSAEVETENKREIISSSDEYVPLEETKSLWNNVLYPGAIPFRRSLFGRCFDTKFRNEGGNSLKMLSRSVPFVFHWTEDVRKKLAMAIAQFDKTVQRPT